MLLSKEQLDQFISFLFEWRYLLAIACGILGWECYLLFAFDQPISYTDELRLSWGDSLKSAIYLILAFFILFAIYKIVSSLRTIFTKTNSYYHNIHTLKVKALAEKDSLLLGYLDKLERKIKKQRSMHALAFYLLVLILINGLAGWSKDCHTIIFDICSYNKVSFITLFIAEIVLIFIGIIYLADDPDTSDIPYKKGDAFSDDTNSLEPIK